MPMTFCNTSYADGHANDFLQRLQSNKKTMRPEKTAYPKTLAY